MRANRVVEIWNAGGVVLNGVCEIANSHTVEIMGRQGFDSIMIDMQHATADKGTLPGLLQALNASTATPIVRVPWNEPDVVMYALDSGAYGVICPLVNSRSDCEKFVKACLYPPTGYRSYGPFRGYDYAGCDYYEKADETVLPLAMVETAEAVEQLDEIVSVAGLRGVYVGPADLSISLGLPPTGPYDNPVLQNALRSIADACSRHGVYAGIHTNDIVFARWVVKAGYRLVTVGLDLNLLRAAAQKAILDAEVLRGVASKAA